MHPLLIDADRLETFTSSDLEREGHTRYEVASAVQRGMLRVVGTVDNGRRGPNPRKLKLTAVGRRAAQLEREDREAQGRADDDGMAPR